MIENWRYLSPENPMAITTAERYDDLDRTLPGELDRVKRVVTLSVILVRWLGKRD